MSKVTETNWITGETVVRDMTESELAQIELDKIDADNETKAKADKTIARQAVLVKLDLTADEVAALLS